MQSLDEGRIRPGRPGASYEEIIARPTESEDQKKTPARAGVSVFTGGQGWQFMTNAFTTDLASRLPASGKRLARAFCMGP